MTSKVVSSKLRFFVVFFFILLANINAQKYEYKVIAKSGDGIFSLLRNEGIDVVKYYEEFIELNEEHIKNGSHLVVGQAYKIPFAPDSFKNAGVRISMQTGKEEAIFINKLASLKRIDSAMQNTVYYLISDSSKPNSIVELMARKLLEHKAKVYVIEYLANDSNGLMNITTVINKKYLKHNGTYQRVLVLHDNNENNAGKTQLSLYHNANSKEGKQLVTNLLATLGNKSINQKSFDDYIGVFSDFKRVAFAKNLLPALTFVELGEKEMSKVKSISISSDENKIADMITGGIFMDYSQMELEDK